MLKVQKMLHDMLEQAASTICLRTLVVLLRQKLVGFVQRNGRRKANMHWKQQKPVSPRTLAPAVFVIAFSVLAAARHLC